MYDFSSSNFSTKTYHVVGTQKNRLNETVLLSTQNMFKMFIPPLLTLAKKYLKMCKVYTNEGGIK